MAKEIKWTPESINRFEAIIEYLQTEWTEKEIDYFIKATDRVVKYISENPHMFRKTNKKNVHEALITSHNLLIYKIYSSHIDLITFWDTRQHPYKKKF